MKEKLEKVLIALEKIARETGEDECEDIFLLAFKKGITISNEISSSLLYYDIAVWVVKPFDKEEFEIIKSALNSRFPSCLVDNILHKIEENNKFYIKYPVNIQIYKIDEDIFEVLTEEHGIDCNKINEDEWGEIKKTEIWKSAIFQTARELVAYNIKNKKS